MVALQKQRSVEKDGGLYRQLSALVEPACLLAPFRFGTALGAAMRPEGFETASSR